MSTPTPTPIPTQTPPPHLERALNLLDGLLLRNDVPTPARLDLSDVYDDLLDVRPPYPPTVPTPSPDTPWTTVIQQITTALQELITPPEATAAPAVLIRYGLAIRALRDTTRLDPDMAGLDTAGFDTTGHDSAGLGAAAERQ